MSTITRAHLAGLQRAREAAGEYNSEGSAWDVCDDLDELIAQASAAPEPAGITDEHTSRIDRGFAMAGADIESFVRLGASAEPAKCCEPTTEERQLLASGEYRPEELWGGDRPTCPKCINKPQQYAIGDLTFERVFKAAGLTNVSDLQAVLDQVERALAAEVQS